MVDYKKTLVLELSTILPTYYELFVDDQTQKPCITYLENYNSALYDGSTIRYSNIGYYIKLWGNNLEQLEEKALLIDDKMTGLGFVRQSYNELSMGNDICLIFDYLALFIE